MYFSSPTNCLVIFLDAATKVVTVFGLTKWVDGIFPWSSGSETDWEKGLVLASHGKKEFGNGFVNFVFKTLVVEVEVTSLRLKDMVFFGVIEQTG